MNIIVNNKPVEIEDGATLQTLAEKQNLPAKGVAVAVNQNMVAREAWNSTTLASGDDVIIIKAVCGG